MNQPTTSTDRIRSILVAAATTGTIAFNWMAATGYVNGVTPDVISDKYATIITPAGYAFTIWSLIYMGLAAFSIFQLLPSQAERFRPVRTLYIVSCVLNCVWIYFWQSEAIPACMIVILGLWLSLLFIQMKLHGCRTLAETWLLQAPFGLYFGWVTVATLVNSAVLLVYQNKMPDGTAEVVFGVVVLLAAAFLGVLARIKLHNFFFPVAVAWALTAIAVKQSGHTMIVVAAAAGVVGCLIASLSFVMNLRSTGNE